MKTSYKKLWKILIDWDMTKIDLRLRAGISSSSLAKLGNEKSVTTAVLLKICEALDWDITDIIASKAAENIKKRKIQKNIRCPLYGCILSVYILGDNR